MTAPQDPLVMTLEEAVEALYPYGMELRAESLTGEGVSWSVFEFSTEKRRPVLVCNGHGTWWEAVSDALGVSVVMRDDAAELRAALEAVYQWLRSEFAEPDPTTGEAVEAAAREIWETVCAALAATEGSES